MTRLPVRTAGRRNRSVGEVAAMEVRLLGPVELWDAGRQVPLGPRQQRCVLAVLAMTPRQPVPADLLIDRVWGERPPRNVRNALYTNLSRLRGTLGRAAGRLRRDDTGYLLDVDDQQVDLLQARRLAAEGRGLAGARPDAAERAVEQLRAAHALWRGTPLGGLTGDWADRARHALTQELLAIATDRFELELAAGRCAEAVGPLSALHADHPLAEAVAGLLMRALSRGGRQSEALQVYALTRAQLAAELGVEPGPALQRLHRQIVRGDPEPPAGQPAPVPPPPAQPPALPPPAQLPPDVAAFVGRHRELRQLDDLRDSRGDATSVVIVAITGTGGVGKTALAVHWAHRLRDRFPDGQLYVNLRGFTPRGSPMEPAEAVRGFLAALQVPAEQLPGSLDAQVGRYRSLLAGRRVVVLLDNARDTTQVRPLLPGTAGCLVIVTSRNQLAGLVVAEGAELLTLGRLPGVEAWQLLAGRVGDHRLASEPGPVQEIIARCAGLPLALAIVGARAAAHPGFALAELADELAGVDDGLDAFDGADPVTGLRAVFSWSYRTLAPPAARLFRVLGLHPGPDLSGPAVASLAGIPAARAGRLLADLTRAHLLSEHRPGRYTLHDLLRTYASELVRALDPPERRSAARHRLLDHYLHTAHAAARLLIPGRGPLQLEPAGAGVTPENLTSERQAWAWFAREHQALLAAIDHAADHGFDTHAWQLAWAVEDFLDRQGHWRDLAAAERLVLGAVTQLGDRGAQAHPTAALPARTSGSAASARLRTISGTPSTGTVSWVTGWVRRTPPATSPWC
jgi:DNA-binding SARP family transcriptional activator